MASDIFGNPLPPEAEPDEALPEPPAPDGPGLFGDPSPPAPRAAEPVSVAPPAPAEPAAPYRVLARKYRPRSFADLIGQEALVRTLRNAFAQGRVHHAFMLTGVRGVGKTTTARIIARALNCIGPDGKGPPYARSLRRLPGMPRHPGRPPPGRAGARRRQLQQRGRRARTA